MPQAGLNQESELGLRKRETHKIIRVKGLSFGLLVELSCIVALLNS